MSVYGRDRPPPLQSRDRPSARMAVAYIPSRVEFRRHVKNRISEAIDVLSGVPQGDHLPPLLFHLFVNDVIYAINHSNVLLFADDTEISKVIDSL